MKPFAFAAVVGAFIGVVAAQAGFWLFDGAGLGALGMTMLTGVAAALAGVRLARPAARVEAAERRAPSSPPAALERGTVKWFNRTKGYGFIARDTGGELFVHQRCIQTQGGRGGLKEGDRVSFVAVSRSKGWQAEQVSLAEG